MTLGTKTLLFGVHQIVIHPLLVTIAWKKLYGSFPSWRELICIVIHDWGYWGVDDLKGAEGDKHPEFGAKIAENLLGREWHDFILGHSSFYIARHGLKSSKLLAPDKYWHCLVPLWFYKLLAVPTGEFQHYRRIQHARQVGDPGELDEVWWRRLQEVCLEKANGKHKIDTTKLHYST